MKIQTKPITASDEIDKSRDAVGLNKWARSSRTIGFLMFILGWFTIPAEVLLRRDFGQRWFTVINFYAGLFLMLLFAILTSLWGGLRDFIYHLQSAITPFYTEEEPSFTDRVMDKSMMFLLFVYMLIGSYHLFKIWWRNRNNTALHSFDDGTSRLEPVAGFLMRPVNALAIPFVGLYKMLLPKKQRQGVQTPKLVNDRTAFANTVVEPLLLLVLAYRFHGIASIWLFMSAIAVAINANWKETARLNKILDFRDSVIEAKIMMELKEKTTEPNAPAEKIMQQAAETINENPQVIPQVAAQYPDLMSIIQEMTQDRNHLAN